MKVALLGLGAMGASIAYRLRPHVAHLTLWNRTAARAAPLAVDGFVVAETAVTAVEKADVVITMVSNPQALYDLVVGDQGIAGHMLNGSILMDMSTIGPIAARAVRDQLPAGVTMVDAPVMGSPDALRTGEAEILLGCNEQSGSVVRPILELLGRVVPTGGEGTGQAAKLVANNALFTVMAALGESIKLADGLGLSRDVTYDVLGTTPLAAQASKRKPAIEATAYPPRFALELAVKDADLIAAASTAQNLPVTESTRRWLHRTLARNAESVDYTSILGEITTNDVSNSSSDGRGVRVSARRYEWGQGCHGWHLIDTASLSVIYEEMPPSASEADHKHNWAAQLFFIVEGSGDMLTDGGALTLTPGESVDVPPGAWHQLVNRSDERLCFVVVSTPHSHGDRVTRASSA